MNASDRLAALRQELSRQGLAGVLVPRSDEHLGEYVPPAAERLAWLTGFTGSAGLAIVLAETAAVWSDGRYVLQLQSETDGSAWERLHLTGDPPAAWVAAHIGGGTLGYDPWLVSEEALRGFTDAGVTVRPVVTNPVDAVWNDRPPAPTAPAVPHDMRYAGVSADDKRAQVAAVLRDQKQDAAILTDPASIAWLLNMRGGDVDFTPFALGFAVLHADGGVELFMEDAKISPALRASFGNAVSVSGRAALPEALQRLRGRKVRLDRANAASWFGATLQDVGADIVAATDPCLMPKARKNAVEQAGARNAHARDAVALCSFLHWLTGAAGRETEMSAAARLLAFRSEQDLFRGESFPAIAGAGEHGAIIHYRANSGTDRAIGRNETFLIDSGGQYLDGTTDVTRTIWTGPDAPPADIRDRFTRVLKGHIALAAAVFPDGVAGVRLDAFARAALWQAGLDYDHGTGHGVGSFLSVHEGPVSLSPHLRPAGFAEGMIVSDEPGFYLPGEYGIRLENLLLVREAPFEGSVEGSKKFLCFEALTLAPFDRHLIDIGLLTEAERHWVDTYHARVLAEVGPHLPQSVNAWLHSACAALAPAEP